MLQGGRRVEGTQLLFAFQRGALQARLFSERSLTAEVVVSFIPSPLNCTEFSHGFLSANGARPIFQSCCGSFSHFLYVLALHED